MSMMKRALHLFMAVIMLLTCTQIPCATADDEPVTITLNVTNTPVQGTVLLEKTGLQLVRFSDETAQRKISSARKALYFTGKTTWSRSWSPALRALSGQAFFPWDGIT